VVVVVVAEVTAIIDDTVDALRLQAELQESSENIITFDNYATTENYALEKFIVRNRSRSP